MFQQQPERLVFFDQNLTPVRDIVGGADELFHFYTNQINPGDFMLFNDAYPQDEGLAYIGMMITGTDANGHKLTFPMLYELSQEFTTSYTAQELASRCQSSHIDRYGLMRLFIELATEEEQTLNGGLLFFRGKGRKARNLKNICSCSR